MKKHLLGLTIVILMVLNVNTYAQATWVAAPTGTNASGTSTNTAYNDIAFDAGNTPYIVYSDGAASNLATVRTYTSGAWQTVGATAAPSASFTSLAINQYTPYIAYVDGAATNKATVKKYSGGAWLNMGAVSTGSAAYTSIAIDAAGTPYVAYQDIANGNKPTVKTYTAGAWTLLGTTVSTVSSSYTYLALDHAGTPYVIYQDVTNGSKAAVKKYSGGVWSSVGSVTISPNSATYLSIDFDAANNPYISYIESSSICTIKTFTAGAWQAVGTGTVANAYTYLNIAVEQNATTPYITFYQTGSYGSATSMFTSGAWAYSGNHPYTLSGTSSYNSIALDASGVPWVTYNDYGYGAYVKKLVTAVTFTTNPAPASVCAGSNATFSAGVTPTTGVTYQWQVNTGSGFTNISSAYNNVYTVPSTSLSQSGYQYRCVANDGVNRFSSAASLSVTPIPTITISSATVCAGTAVTVSAGGAGGSYSWNTGATTQNIIVSPTVTTGYTVTGTQGPGCSSVAHTTITTLAVPVVAVNGNAPLCFGSAETLTASGTSIAYSWNTGPTTATLSVNPSVSTTYTVYGNNASGCVTTVTVNVTVSPVPTVAIAPFTPICQGSTLNLYDNSTGTLITWLWNGPNSFTSNLQNPSLVNAPVAATGTYSLNVTNSFGCSGTATTAVVVHALPAITATGGPYTICAGASATLSATGITTYTWSASTGTLGLHTQSITVTPTVPTTYSISGKDANGCQNTQTINITAVAKTLSGNVTSTSGAVSGNVILYRYSPLLSKWDSVTVTTFSTSYSFGAVDSAKYVVEAIPTATNVQITYGGSAISWQGATVITHGCTGNSTQNIQVQPYVAIAAGTGTLAGTIREGSGYVHKGTNVEFPGQPIGGIVVKGGKNPGGSIFSETVTDLFGHYSFNNVPDSNDSYFILVDIPGLDTNTTYHKVLTLSNNSYVTLDFTVDSMYVNPVLSTSINALNQSDYQVKLFPNPAKNYVTIQYSLVEDATVSIDLFDITGKKVQPLKAAEKQAPGNYTPVFDTGALTPGMYFVKLFINKSEATVKLFVTD